MIKRLLFALTITALICACANRGYPEGGPRDETPPEIIKEEPYSYSTNFSGNKLKIYFNEFVQLKDVNSSLMVSPPLKKKPTVSNRGKYIVVDFSRDTLKENSTYNLDFGTSIVDNNEGNPLGYYRYVFSTGSEIDTMEIGGKLVDAESGDPLMKILVAIYKNHHDSAVINELPAYVALTDSAGNFRFTNIQDTLYRLVAFEDANTDYKYIPESENVGFIDTIIKPIVFPATRIDTIYKTIQDTLTDGAVVDTLVIDSIAQVDYLAYGPANLFVRLFGEEKTQNYMESPKRSERENIATIFAMPQGGRDLKLLLTDSLLADTVGAREWYRIERNPSFDTIKIWLTDTFVSRRDTLNLVFNYLKSDSLKNLVPSFDTIRMNYKPENTPKKGKKQKMTAQDSLALIYTEAKTNRKSLDIGERGYILFDHPVLSDGLDSITLEIKRDTVFEPINFTLEQDSLNFRKYWIETEYISGAEYKMKIDTAQIHTIYGKPILGLENSFTVKKAEEYGTLKVKVTNTHNRPILIEVYQAKKGSTSSKKNATTSAASSFKILKSRSIDHDGEVLFDLMNEGSYMIRAVIDENRNGKWDTGRYLEHRQPENVKYQYIEIPIKSNFDVEQDFDLDIEYTKPIEEENKNKR